VRWVADAPDGEVGFEELYAGAGEDLAAIPWALLSAHPALTAWFDSSPAVHGQTALVVGCGLGDDAEELSRRGYGVTAFDIAPTAIARCWQRFPDSKVDYRVADLFVLPGEWRAAFDLVVEIRTLQSLPIDRRGDAARTIAGLVRHGGRVFVRCLARDEGEAVALRPWPVSRSELGAFVDAGLTELEFREEAAADGRGRSFTVLYARN
jgi:SAM-dependent methyltransferase